MSRSVMKEVITNALIRCTRADHIAVSGFELVRKDLGLWVRELPGDIEGVVDDLKGIRVLLKELGNGSSDYTLHLAAAVDEHRSIILPPALTKLAGDCGFSIEVVSDF